MKEAGVETLRLDPAEPRNVTVGQPPELGATDAPRPAWARSLPACPRGVRGDREDWEGAAGLRCPAAAVPRSRAPAGRLAVACDVIVEVWALSAAFLVCCVV